MLKKLLLLLLTPVLCAALAGCVSSSPEPAGQTAAVSSQPNKEAKAASEAEAAKMEVKNMLITVKNGDKVIEFQLNDTSPARSFYEMLPMQVEVRNYSDNEKVFDLSGKLDTHNSVEGECPVGTIAYFSPWNSIAMYYGPFGSYSGLYTMGKAVSGEAYIKNLHGTLQIERK